ncbi:hypothetical protein OH76DRAFT_1395122 [Lentinus brumalis]|uniref:Uncharacterized protein n=1 Tax=Lentinus brumalis TaxID=2498619 RepID=A0A371DXQ8_9APHY|nr:hypothetical protein OH76DRAFT_1395122 [Polyporus brumalis]
MNSLVTSAGKKLFERNLKDYAPQDPLYETYTDKKGRQRRRKRETPPGLSARDAKILKSVQRRAHYLDKGFHMCGMRFGWTFLIGIIPGAGDAADAALNYLLVVRKAKQAEIPGWLLRQMLLNNAISAVVGFVPFIGDVVLAMYKANSRNAALLEEFLRIRGEEYLKATQQRVEDPETVRPGAGREPQEVVPGKKPERSQSGLSTATGWFRRGSKGSKQAKQKAVTTGTPPVPSPERGRFVEDVPSTAAEGSKHR